MDITALGSAMLLLGHALFCVGAFGFGLFEHAVLSENVYKNDFALYSATFVIIFGALFFFLSSAIVTAIDRVACEYRYSQNALSYSTAYMVWMSILSLILLFAGVSMPIFPFLLVIVGTAAVCSVNFVLPILYEKHAKETRKLFEEEEAVLTVFMKNKNLTDISQAREMRNRSKSASEILNSEDQ